jgi:hypothetical protein
MCGAMMELIREFKGIVDVQVIQIKDKFRNLWGKSSGGMLPSGAAGLRSWGAYVNYNVIC